MGKTIFIGAKDSDKLELLLESIAQIHRRINPTRTHQRHIQRVLRLRYHP
jgi:hypothetical protein